jgi:hypothetical protein
MQSVTLIRFLFPFSTEPTIEGDVWRLKSAHCRLYWV